MDKKKISKDYLEKIKLLEAYNKNYYDNNSPIISDQEYDFFKKKIIDLENSYKFLNNKNSPSKIVGFKPSKNFEKVKHKVPMLSLGNAFDEEDLKSFETQHNTEAYSQFVDSYLGYVSASRGMPIEVLKMQFGQNYSASRGSLLLFWRIAEIWRKEMADDYLNPVFESWLSEEIAKGTIQAPGFSDPVLRQAWLDCRWIGAPMPNIDPMRTAKADMLYVEMGAQDLDRVAQNYNGSDGRTNRQKLKTQFEELPWAKWTLKPSELEESEDPDKEQ